MRLLTLASALLLASVLSGPVQAGEGCPYAKAAAAKAGAEGAAAVCSQACSHAKDGEGARSCACSHAKPAEEVTAEATADEAEPARASTAGGALAAGQ